MTTFSQYLIEAKNISKLTHLTHIEEAILHLGFNGARESIEILRSIRDELAGNASSSNQISLKWDGAPALIFGIDPADGQFFVGTKGVFAKEPKLVKTKEDISRLGYSGELANKLSVALNTLPKLNPKGVYQGDMMFTKGDLQSETIDGTKYITFTPNTITYAIPADSNLAKELQKAKIGIVIHTTYEGKESLEAMTAMPGQIDISTFTNTSDVWFDDPYLKDMSGRVTMTASETTEVTRYLSRAGKIFQQMSKKEVQDLFNVFDELPKSAVGARLETFINQLVRSNSLPEPGKGRKFASKYKAYLESYWNDKVLAKLKTDSAKQRKKQFFDEWKERVDYTAIAKLLDFMAYINEAKRLLLNKLETGAESMSTFVWTGDGYRVTSGEGYVVTDKMSGNTHKIVDRLEFSRLNFSSSTAKFGQRTNESVELQEGVYDANIFHAIFLAGGPGSGKSYVANNVTKGFNLKIINSDDIFENALKKANMEFDLNTMSPEDFDRAMELRSKSKTLTNKKMSLLLEGRIGLVIDGTGKDYDKIKVQVDELKKLGYEPSMIFVNTTLDVAMQRNEMRPRKLPEDIVKKSWNQVQDNMGKFQNLFQPKNFILVDNNNATEDVLNKVRKRISNIISKPPKNYIAKKWIEKELEMKRRK